MEERINAYLRKRKDAGLFRTLVKTEPARGCRVEIDGETYHDLSSNDYLGFSRHEKILEAARGALDVRLGSCASRLMTGTYGIHLELERAIAAFKGKDHALFFNSGYHANVGIISALCGRGDVVFSDRLNHASITDGIRLSGAVLKRFRHNDTGHLEELLSATEPSRRALIVTESVFSMDGDIAPLKDIARLSDRYGCMLMVDEAHATGIFGDNGGGVAQREGVSDKVDLLMGTFSKALGGFGAYLACSREIRDHMVNSCRSFIYSTSLPVSIAAANIKALELVRQESSRRKELLRKSREFRMQLDGCRYEVLGETQIVPLVVGDVDDTLRLSGRLRSEGYWVTPVRPPTVPEGAARIRISISSEHPEGMLRELALRIKGV